MPQWQILTTFKSLDINHIGIAPKKGYSGVLTITKEEPKQVQMGFGIKTMMTKAESFASTLAVGLLQIATFHLALQVKKDMILK